MNEVWLQLIIMLGSVFSAGFAMFRYFISQSIKRERMMLEYFEVKNGHMERMSKNFTNASNKMSKSINNLATKIEIMSIKRKK